MRRVMVVGSCPDVLAPTFRALAAEVYTTRHIDLRQHPDLVVCFPDSDRVAGFTRLVRTAAARWPVVVIATSDWPHAATVLAAGAHLYLAWDRADTVLDLSKLITALAPPATGHSPGLDALSRREREALSYIAAGYTHQQTARRMCVAKATVDTFVERIKTKLGVRSKAELTARYHEPRNVTVGPREYRRAAVNPRDRAGGPR